LYILFIPESSNPSKIKENDKMSIELKLRQNIVERGVLNTKAHPGYE